MTNAEPRIQAPSGMLTAPQTRRGATFKTLRRFVVRKPLGAFGAGIVLVLFVVALFAPLIAPHDPNESIRGARLVAPTWSHVMGTDNLGRDLFSRLIYGARISLVVGLGASIVGIVSGVALGLVSGYLGGKVDEVMQRIIDSMMAFPGLILALALVAMLGPSIRNVLIAIALGSIPNTTRVVRGAVLSVKQEDYVQASRSLGATGVRIAVSHLLPNIMAPVLILASVMFGTAIIAEASLSFLGLGIQPPTPSWGAMLSGPSRRFMTTAPWMAIFPGLAISIVIFGINIFGDALRDVLDPRLRG